MSRSRKPNWNKRSSQQIKSDNKELQKLVKNQNRKIDRILAKDPTLINSLPSKLSYKELKKEINTRADYNKITNQIESFNKRGGEKKYVKDSDVIFFYDKTLDNKLKRAIDKFNKEVDKDARANPTNKNALPEKKKVREYKKIINTKTDLQREIEALNRYRKKRGKKIVSLPGNNYNTKITLWELEELEHRAEKVSAERKKRQDRLKDVELTHRGKGTGITAGMGSSFVKELDPINPYYPTMGHRDRKMKYHTLMKESQSDYWDSRDRDMRENYIKGIKKHFDKYPNMKKLTDKINSMPIDDFIIRFTELGGNEFEYYAPPGQEQIYYEKLYSDWLGVPIDLEHFEDI